MLGDVLIGAAEVRQQLRALELSTGEVERRRQLAEQVDRAPEPLFGGLGGAARRRQPRPSTGGLGVEQRQKQPWLQFGNTVEEALHKLQAACGKRALNRLA